MTIYDVAPMGGDIIGRAASREDAWMLCHRYGLVPHSLTDAGVVELVASDGGSCVWRVQCKHTEYPYDRGAFENRRRDKLATLGNGLPAWPVAEENEIAFQTFKRRLQRGWSGQRAATEGARELKRNPDDEWEAEALKNGISVQAYRSRVRGGCPESIAATMGLSWRQW
ncbi:hypothetical protein [Pseudooceanicola antarcticus]|uniref:hypothetical protein n=1 Tax=Pseudooceanicola antarcticus TaxID=1247613 RepID=UPI00117A6AA8|nr:hypothetical protein [Pseudooceanicola antarcticus]